MLVRLLGAYRDDTETIVWEAVEAVLVGLNKLLLDDAALSSKFKAFAARLIGRAAERVGWEPRAEDGHLGGLQRACMVRLQARSGHALQHSDNCEN